MVLQSDKQQKLREKKDVNIKRLKDGLALYNQENDTSYAIAETRVQGSMAMATVVQNDENDCDIDVAIANTIADGTAVKRVGEKIFPYAEKNIDEVITVADDDLIGAFLDVVENHKMIVENSGLLTVAALRQLDLKGKKVVSILSGGNMDVITMSSIVQHGLIQRDRIFSVSVLLPDKPGELVRVAATIAKANGNVIKLEHNQFVSTNRNAAVELRITLEAFGTEHKHQIMKALEDEGLSPREVNAKLY